MLTYVSRRLLTMILTLLVISALVFIIIQLPPGDYLSSYIAQLQSQGEMVPQEKIDFLRGQPLKRLLVVINTIPILIDQASCVF